MNNSGDSDSSFNLNNYLNEEMLTRIYDRIRNVMNEGPKYCHYTFSDGKDFNLTVHPFLAGSYTIAEARVKIEKGEVCFRITRFNIENCLN